ncbi:hypothetical protein F5X68DRAFT_190098 [Plectosphaerella plurivora]|uniref:histidine kinase n=1 Tax=Plectosphaerella plurivora TaxID=936078 RepID=A0A9P8VEV0_9PEZI|nr:hypothetical protein F5X68DRAFT_190098 [Plectosphaerella plurivora]
MHARSDRVPPGHRPVKAVTESARERETFKYDPSLYTSVRFNDTGVAIPSSEIVSSYDSVLTSLAQLGAYQTGAERAFISLFDVTHQYVIAETVPGMALTPLLPSDQCPSPLALCGIAIPRSQGTCDHVLYLTTPGSKEDTDLPLSLVPNLAADSRFNTRPYCQFADPGQFYAAVPIRTHRGIDIGSYCVMSTRRPKEWNDDSPNRLRDVSRAVMAHLEATRSVHVNTRSERLSRGVRSFLEGENTITRRPALTNSSDSASTVLTGDAQSGSQQSVKLYEEPTALSSLSTSTQSSPEPLASTTPPRTEPQQLGFDQRDHEPAASALNYTAPPSKKTSTKEQQQHPTGDIFSRASSIVREAFDVDGCYFLDVSLGHYRRPSLRPLSGDNVPTAEQMSSTSGSDGTSTDGASHGPDNMCKQLGFCTSQASCNDPSTTSDDAVGQLPKRTLERLLRRYPKGHIFNFDAVGDLESSESSDSSDGEERPDVGPEAASSISQRRGSVGFSPTTAKANNDRAKQRRLREGALIQAAFPQARSVAFVPVWDTKRDRWLAGGFVYTRMSTRVLTLDGDMSFLRAFANLAATEFLNQEVRQADKAKSDALGSLSHELRTPLHGILLGTELLNDTDLDVLQGNLTHTIETCCATLMDTIDHLLDYSKVNDLATKRKKEAGGSYDTVSSITSVQPGKKQLFTEVRLDALVEDVADSMYAGHTFKRFPHSARDPKGTDTVIRRTNSIPLADLESSMYGPWQPESDAGGVAVRLSIDPACNWMFRLEAGAVRRVVMNLLGNALKYTARGSITVTLTQSESSNKRRKSERNVRLVVKDTGKGISDDFLQHELFRPFSQEDDLAPGTGLGLSLVKTIVDGLGGRISVKSAVGVGSTFTVTLPLEQISHAAEETRIGARDNEQFEQQLVELKGLRVQICGFDDANARSVIESICRDWLHLDVSDDASLAPDIMLWAHDRLITSGDSFKELSRHPHIIICHDAFTAYHRSSECASAGQPGVFEFISQPIGPRKLARSIQLAYERWTSITPIASTTGVRPGGHSRMPSATDDLKMAAQVAAPATPMEAFERLSVHDRSSPRPGIAEPVNSYFPTDLAPGQETAIPRHSVYLLVDDNHINLKVLSAYMGKLGLRHATAVNGLEAVEAYAADPGRFAAVLMDLSMPVMDGLEATRRIRAREAEGRLSRVKILALTGLASERTYQEALQSGVDVFLTKPVRLQVLSEQLDALAGGGKLVAGGAGGKPV